jgi:hypothetical protein
MCTPRSSMFNKEFPWTKTNHFGSTAQAAKARCTISLGKRVPFRWENTDVWSTRIYYPHDHSNHPIIIRNKPESIIEKTEMNRNQPQLIIYHNQKKIPTVTHSFSPPNCDFCETSSKFEVDSCRGNEVCTLRCPHGNYVEIPKLNGRSSSH